MAQYREGTANVVNGSANVTGSGTLWSANVAAGDLFVVVGSGVVYEVANTVSNTQIQLTAPYAGTTANGVSYAITRDFTPIRDIPIISKGDVETAAILKRAFMIIDGLL